MNCSCQGRVGMELESGFPQSQRLLQPGHSDLAAHPSLGAHQGQVLAAPSHLLQSTRGGGTQGKNLKEQLRSQLSSPTKHSMFRSQDAEGAKVEAQNWDALARPRQEQQFFSRSKPRFFQESSGSSDPASTWHRQGQSPGSWERSQRHGRQHHPHPPAFQRG